MTTETLIHGIAESIDHVFKDYKIYEDEIEQGLDTPCFLISEIDNSLNLVLGNRYQSSHSFDIHYFPKENNVREMHQVSDALFGALEYIHTEEGLIMGSNLRSKIQDGVLHFLRIMSFLRLRMQKRKNPCRI